MKIKGKAIVMGIVIVVVVAASIVIAYVLPKLVMH